MAEVTVPYEFDGRKYEGVLVYDDSVTEKRPAIFMQPDWCGVCLHSIDMSDEPTCAEKYGDAGPMTEEAVVAGGHMANVFVYVKEGLSGDFSAPSSPVVLDQNGCRYVPHVVGVMSGQDLTTEYRGLAESLIEDVCNDRLPDRGEQDVHQESRERAVGHGLRKLLHQCLYVVHG